MTSTHQVDDEWSQDAGHVAHDVDEGDTLSAYHGGEQLRGVLQSDVVGNVHRKTTNYCKHSSCCI